MHMTDDCMDTGNLDAIQQQLLEWQEQGKDSLSPLRFLFMQALSRRIVQYGGTSRRMLEDRLSRKVQAYRDEVVLPASKMDGASGNHIKQDKNHAVHHPLADLLAYAGKASGHSGQWHGQNADDTVRQYDFNLDPALIDYFRNTWAKASANGLLRQAQARVPDNAGPLNSNSLAHRALMLMRERSPEYLQHFLAYVDTLSWLEQLNDERTGQKPVSARRKAGKKQD